MTMMYRLVLFVALQALCLQMAYSQAIDYATEDTETKTDLETITSLDNQPTVEETNQAGHLICPQCGRPTHLCECGYYAATISGSYSKVSEESLCPKCGLSVDLCTCATEADTEPKPTQLYGPCGLPIELCQCGKKAATETTDNQLGNPVCPNCGLPTHLCNCGSEHEVAETEAFLVNEPETPQVMCPDCGLPIEHCTCGAQF